MGTMAGMPYGFQAMLKDVSGGEPVERVYWAPRNDGRAITRRPKQPMPPAQWGLHAPLLL